MYRALIAAIGGLAFAIAPSAEAAARCYTVPERAAVQVRMLQTELMVATLSCRGWNEFDYPSRYNEFIGKHSARLVANGRALQSHFQRSFGDDDVARNHLDRFVTQLANSASHRSIVQTDYFCAAAKEFLNDVAVVEPARLESYSGQRFADRDDVELTACAPPAKPRPVKAAVKVPAAEAGKAGEKAGTKIAAKGAAKPPANPPARAAAKSQP